ncbi:MAG: LTA synthase family protein [Spirochaetaceae bacterium]
MKKILEKVLPLCAYLCFVSLYVIGRPLLISRISAEELQLSALAIEGFFALFLLALAMVVSRFHISVSALLLFLFVLHRVVSMETVLSLSTVPNLWDLRFARGELLTGSAFNLSFPGYLLLLLLSCGLVISMLRKMPKTRRVLYISFFTSASALIVVILLTPPGATWRSTDLSYFSLRKTVSPPAMSWVFDDSHAREDTLVDGKDERLQNEGRLETDEQFRLSNAGESAYIQKPAGEKRNVLLLVLEGIPGAYLRQVQQYMGIEYPVLMEELSSAVEDALIVPNFFTHSRQTIRGLYAMLSGNYSRLTAATPKVYDYLALPEEERPLMFPEILRREGYRTHYLQAAGLGYMSKDRFMPAAGYQEVLGKSFFDYRYVDSVWGPDDKSYLEQSLSYIKELNRGESHPWFLTLLTAGTHHPYAVPEHLADSYPNPREAAVAYLDEALGDFLQGLEEEGITEETLIVVTSDESHGVAGHPHGRFWGLLAVLAPESRLELNKGVFGLIDIPTSILDYLGIERFPPHFSSYSFMRPESKSREMLFGSCYSEEKGVFMERAGTESVVSYTPPNGEMFDSSYEQEHLRGDEGEEKGKLISNLLSSAFSLPQTKSSRSREIEDPQNREGEGKVTEPREYHLLRKNEFELTPSGETLTSGQYFSFPENSTVTITLKAHSLRGRAEVFSQILQVAGDKEFPHVDIPSIPSGGKLRLRFRFPVHEEISRVWAVLSARSEEGKGEAVLEVSEYTLKIAPDKLADSFEVMELELSEGGNPDTAS